MKGRVGDGESGRMGEREKSYLEISNQNPEPGTEDLVNKNLK
jgi:hypothetical protein